MSSDVNRSGEAITPTTLPRGPLAMLVAGLVLAIVGCGAATVAWERAQASLSELDIRRILDEEKGIYPNDYVFVWVWVWVWVGAAVAVLGLVFVIIAIFRWRASGRTALRS